MGIRLGRCVICAMAVGGTGCATIAHGSRQGVTLTSDPSGATVTVLSGGTVKSTPGVTPIKLHLTRRDPNLTVRLEKAGCAPVEMRLKRSLSGWVFGNLIWANPFAQQGMDSASAANYAGLLGVTAAMFAADFLTGGAHKLPKAVDVRLCSPGGAPVPPRPVFGGLPPDS